MKFDLPASVTQGDPETLESFAGYLADLSALLARLAAQERRERDRRAKQAQDRETWFQAARAARDLVITGHPPDLAAKIAADAFGQDQAAIRRALDSDGVRNGPMARFQRDFLIYQMSRAGMSNRQICAAFLQGVSEPTISRAVRRFVDLQR